MVAHWRPPTAQELCSYWTANGDVQLDPSQVCVSGWVGGWVGGWVWVGMWGSLGMVWGHGACVCAGCLQHSAISC